MNLSPEHLLFWIPLLPLLGFLVNGLLGRRLPRPAVTAIGCLAPGLAFVVGAAAFLEVASGEGKSLQCPHAWTWIHAGDLSISFAFSMSRLSGVMTLVVTGIGTLIHVYSSGYMREDPGYARFFAYLNLFMAAMLVLVLGDNLVLLFLGWEGVGLCSYLLIGFWYKDLANSRAGMKAFVVNRIGDFGFLLGMFLIHQELGTLQLDAINAAAPGKAGDPALFWIGLLLFIGATGKSAQIPLYVWLPDAMAGPTPVSALIHAATMVTSGVYLLARLGPLFLAAPGVLEVVAVVGTLTAVLAALIAVSQSDIKKVLAYSTVSQLGYMFLAAGLGRFDVAIFHVVTHAFFKALLFLGAGAVIHSLHHEQDMRTMGGLLRRIPWTAGFFLAGALALAGFPLTSGFFSKDEILHEALHGHRLVLWTLAYATAIFTAFYTFRQYAMVFLGSYRGKEGAHGHGAHGDAHGSSHGGAQADAHGGAHGHTIHESPLSMLVPLGILAVLALAGGFLPVPQFLEPARPHAPLGELLPGYILGAAAAIAGIALALVFFWKRADLTARFTERTRLGRAFTRLSSNKFYIDELYDALIVKPIDIAANLLFILVDRVLIDILLVKGAGGLARGLGGGLRRLQTGRIPSYTLYFLLGVLVVLSLMAWTSGT